MENGAPAWKFRGDEGLFAASDITVRGILYQLMTNLNAGDGRAVVPLGHGDPSAFPCFRTAPAAEDAVVDALRSAKFNCYGPTVLTVWELMNLSCPSNSWQRLILRTMLTKWHLPGIANVLRSSPSSEVLDIHIMPGEVPSMDAQEAWLHLYKICEGNYWDLQDRSFRCLANCLRIVTASSDIKEDHVIQLVQFLLREAFVLQKLVVSTGPNDSSISVKESKEFSDKLLSFPRGSPQAVVVFSNA